MKKKKTGAFFDLDDTILKGNSSVLWGFLMFRKGQLPFRFFFRAALYGGLYKLGLFPYDLAITKVIATLKGQSSVKAVRLTKIFFEKNKISMYRPRLLQQIGMHKGKKHEIVIITQTLDFIAKIFAKDLGIKHIISTEVETSKGKFTGNVKPCVGYRKDDLMWQISEKLNIDLKKSYAYTDSMRDLEMLEKVGHKFVVNPDARLGVIAKRKGWNIWRI
jgi:HAD superfamily hydrolase (TIGR01490 family)